MEASVVKIEGTIQPYAWGGQNFLAELTGRTQPSDEPWAELWLGTHPKGPAKTAAGTLADLISDRPAEVLSPKIADRFEQQLPFLFKVLDVQDMLSIQVHPTKSMAEAGFAREEASGIDRLAPNRSYRDRNHKPELAVALTDFYLLHGFRNPDEISLSLAQIPGWAQLKPILDEGGLGALYQRVMQADVADLKSWLTPLNEQLTATKELTPMEPGYWAKRAFERYGYDRGIFSIYWFNLVHLPPGVGIFQAARIPHAYLGGSCVELMANSDNVLRGGLTPKHIDVAELMKTVDFTPIIPMVLRGLPQANGWTNFPTPVPDFSLYSASLNSGQQIALPDGPAIILVLSGELGVGELRLQKGEAAWLSFGHQASVRAFAASECYLAAVPNT